MATIKKTESNSVGEDVEKLAPSCTVGGTVKMVQTQYRKFKIEVGNNPELLKTKSQEYFYTHTHCSIFHKSQNVETTLMSTDEWTDKYNVICTYSL